MDIRPQRLRLVINRKGLAGVDIVDVASELAEQVQRLPEARVLRVQRCRAITPMVRPNGLSLNLEIRLLIQALAQLSLDLVESADAQDVFERCLRLLLLLYRLSGLLESR